MQVKGKHSNTVYWTYSRLFAKTGHLYLSTILGTSHLKNWNNTTMELSPEGSRAPKAISFNDIENVVKFINSMFCLQVVRWCFLWDLPFSPHLPIDSAQNEWNNLILIIKHYLQTQLEFFKRNKVVIFVFAVRIFFRLFWRHHQCMYNICLMGFRKWNKCTFWCSL